MTFENEKTYLKLVESGNVEDFHKQYEHAAEKIVDEFGEEHPLWIGGEKVHSKGGTFEDHSPNDTRMLLGKFQKGTVEDAKRAVQAANDAFPDWSRIDYNERVEIFRRVADLACERKYNLAALMTYENGKNRYEAIADIDEAVDLIRWYCDEMVANSGFSKEMGRYTSNERTRSVLKPFGVWAVVSPFNFPLAITVGMATGAMITGNTAVLKPSSDTPYLALKFYDMLVESGLPPGVLNFLSGPGGTVGQELVENDDVAGMVFTGSREVGIGAFKTFTSKFPKPIIAEMGGKNATIVTANADIEKAVEGIARAAFGYGGQKCSACSRVIVHKSIRETFLKSLVAYTKNLKTGNPIERDVFMGPVINKAAYEKFQMVASKIAGDGGVLTGGKVLTNGALNHGYYVEPTIIDGLPRDHFILYEELFLPVLAVVDYESFDDAIKVFNSVDYGLTGGIFTEEENEIDAFFDGVDTGTIYANRTMGATTGAIVGAQPFVGWKMSGISGKGAGGHHYLQQFMREQSQTKYV